MIGIDTNVLLRIFLRDDQAQLDQARRIIAEAVIHAPVLINPIVLSEFAWTLSKGIKLSRKDVASYIESILGADDLKVVFRASAERALAAFRSGKADYPDYFLACINSELGCSTTATFDQAALDFEAFSRVS